MHWTDGAHREEDGCDERGTRPQQGIDILKEELVAPTFKHGIATATDDVSGEELVPNLVHSARNEEIAYATKRGVYKVVPRSHQRSTGGKVIWTGWVPD